MEQSSVLPSNQVGTEVPMNMPLVKLTLFTSMSEASF